MNGLPVLPVTTSCPNCKSRSLKEIVYGLVGPNVPDDVVIGGCEYSDEAPTKACADCDWQGCLGGRSWAYQFTQRTQIYDETSPTKARVEETDYNMRTMSDDDLIELGRGKIIARFELVHRGFDPAKLDEIFDEDLPMPLLPKFACYVFYNVGTKKIDLACIFQAQRTMHEFFYLLPGMDDWGVVDTVADFQDLVFSMKETNTILWSLDLPENFSDEDFMAMPTNYGSPALKSFIAGESIEPDEMLKEGGFFKEKHYWPYWFDAGFMTSYVNNPFLPR
jgi:hypothetical protein